MTDEASSELISLNDLYAETTGKNRVTGTFTLGTHTFQVDHFHVATRAPHQDHSIHFCAHQRSVTRKKLAEKIPNLGNKLKGADGNGPSSTSNDQGFTYTGYVSGEYLDKTVNAERTNFQFSDAEGFHQLLASDVPFADLQHVTIGSKKRCDLLVINKPAAFSHTPDDVSSVVIVELKRPERDDYTLADNPLQQVLDYINEIRAGKANRVDGRTIRLSDHTPFYVYIVSDITPTLGKVIKDHSVLTQTPDAQGFFGFFRNHNAYVEIMTFQKLIGDAKKRNRVWFKTLGIE